MLDIERGPISKLERTMDVWRRLLIQRRNVYILVTIWVIFVMVLYDIPEQIYETLHGVNTTAVVEVLREQLPVVELAPAPPSRDSIKRFAYVQKHVELYDGQLSTLYEFNSRLRNDLDLGQISADMQVVITRYDYHCLAAIHIGHPKNIMRIGGRIYVNSKIIGTNSEIIHSKEESAFYPGYEIVKERHGQIELIYFDDSGNEQTAALVGINAICAQHCIDTINGVKFKQNEEL